MGRLLGAARLSHSTDGSTSIERQCEQIQHTAAARGDKIIHITEDVDVSGAVSPFERDELGPWLTEAGKITQWDVLCVAKLDRLTRSLKDFVTLVEWCQAHGKSIVSIGDSFDLATPVGRMTANILVMFAQFERERMSERRADHTKKSRSLARWDGRAVAPGYKPVKVADHWELEPDDEKAGRIRAMADAVISGVSARQTGARYGMDASGVLSILRNPSLRGYVVARGGIVRGDDGLPVTREPILDDETWAKLQAALDKKGSPGSGRANGQESMLLGVAECGTCGKPLYIYRRKEGNRYRHADGSECKGSYLASALESEVEKRLLDEVGDVEQVDYELIPGKNYDAEIRRIEDSIAELDASFEAGDVPASAYGRMQARLEAKLAHLRSLPSTPDTVREISLGKTYREIWAELGDGERGGFLRDNGVKLRVTREAIEGLAGNTRQIGKLQIAVDLGDLQKLLQAARLAAVSRKAAA